MLEKLDHEDDQYELGQPDLEIVEALDEQDIGRLRRVPGRIDVADEQLLQPEREDERHRAERVTVDDLDHVRDGDGAQIAARPGIELG